MPETLPSPGGDVPQIPSRGPQELLKLMRSKNPLVQCMLTPVSLDITCNVLLAAGAAPAAVCAEEETPAFLPKADALYINMGTLTAARVREVTVAIREATRLQKPWVLDPVACGGTPHRTEHCAAAMKKRPTIVRGNSSEVIALAAAACAEPPRPTSGAGPRGTESTSLPTAALPAADALAREFGSVVVISGAMDIITDGHGATLTVAGGSELLTKITGAGCALSALVAAFLGSCPELPLEAAVAACAMYSSAAEPGPSAHGTETEASLGDPASMRVHLIARLHLLGTRAALSQHLSRISLGSGAETPRIQKLDSDQPAGPPPRPESIEIAEYDGDGGNRAGMAVEELDAQTAAQQTQLLFHPVVLRLLSGSLPDAAAATLKDGLAALLALSVVEAHDASPRAGGHVCTHTVRASAAVSNFTELLGGARADGRGGHVMAAAGLVRVMLRLGRVLGEACGLLNKDGPGGESASAGFLDKASLAAAQAAGEALAGRLVGAARERSGVLAAFSATEALRAEAAAFYEGGVRAVLMLLREIDEADEGMLMMSPAEWDGARVAMGKVLGCEAPVLTAVTPTVLIVAGSDSSGGAGIQADIKACQAAGAYAMTAVSALTAQNTTGVQGIMKVPGDFVEQQILSCLADVGANVVKTGMLASAEMVESVAQAVGRQGVVRWVVDPVMVATSGHVLVAPEAVDAIVTRLFPLAHIITPNLPETALLLGLGSPVTTVEGMVDAAKKLAAMGPRWVLVKGGHMEGGTCADVLLEASTQEVTVIEGRYVASEHTHGTGCTLASTIAAMLARGLPTVEAVTRAKLYVWDAIRCSSAIGVGAGHGPLNHQFVTAHWRSPWADRQLRCAAPLLHRGRLVDLSVYAVTDDEMIAAQGMALEQAVEAAIAGGVTVVQLRQKSLDSAVMLKSALAVLPVCRRHGVPLLINDRVDIALAADADGVHVGQDDLPCAVVRAMLGPHKLVGVTVKTPELALKAERDGADYVGSGAVYATSTKDSSAIGVAGVAAVCRASSLPVVAIGGLNRRNCQDAIRAGAAGVAVVSAVFNTTDPREAAEALSAAVKAARM